MPLDLDSPQRLSRMSDPLSSLPGRGEGTARQTKWVSPFPYLWEDVLSFETSGLTFANLNVTVLACERSLPSVDENTLAPTGDQVSSLLQGNFSDSDSAS